jgi:hypothetical protein
MANHELQLHDIIDKDRFHIIDLYKQNTILWCREIAASRDKTQAAWTQIANDASSPNRTIPGKKLYHYSFTPNLCRRPI